MAKKKEYREQMAVPVGRKMRTYLRSLLGLLFLGAFLLTGATEAHAQRRFTIYASGNVGEARAPDGVYEGIFKIGKGAGAALGLRLHHYVEVAPGRALQPLFYEG